MEGAIFLTILRKVLFQIVKNCAWSVLRRHILKMEKEPEFKHRGIDNNTPMRMRRTLVGPVQQDVPLRRRPLVAIGNSPQFVRLANGTSVTGQAGNHFVRRGSVLRRKTFDINPIRNECPKDFTIVFRFGIATFRYDEEELLLGKIV